MIKKINYYDKNNFLIEEYYRKGVETPDFTKKRIESDWCGNTKTIKGWTEINPDSVPDVITNYTYDLTGNTTSKTNPSGEFFENKYDSLGQLERTEYDDFTYETFTQKELPVVSMHM